MIGQRIVVRRVLPGLTGPTGGPAMTDTLGICEHWADGLVRVRREDGSVVEIQTAHIVSGKPVPPRPSVRGRVSVRDAESHAAPLWTGVDRAPLGEWELRHEPAPVDRARKRTNSCLALGDPGTTPAEAERQVIDFYRSRGREPLVQVEADGDHEAAFTARGWTLVPGGEAVLLLGSVSRALRAVRRRAGATPFEGHTAIDPPRIAHRLSHDDEQVARGRAALDGDWIGLHDLEVAPSYRRRGAGRQVVAALLEWGAEQGATTVWLHAETDNDSALAFHEALGLMPHHVCRYLAAPASG